VPPPPPDRLYWSAQVDGRLVAKQAAAGGYHHGGTPLELGVRKAGLALFSGTIAGPQAVSPYGSVAQLDRALASGARGRAFESRRAHSGKIFPRRYFGVAGVFFGCTLESIYVWGYDSEDHAPSGQPLRILVIDDRDAVREIDSYDARL
jgi:hypothetical protein